MWTRVACQASVVVRCRSHVDLDPRLVQGEARERHVRILPADKAAQPADADLDGPEPAPVALPQISRSWFVGTSLRVVQREAALGIVVEQGVVERPWTLGSTSVIPVTSQTPCSRATSPSRSASGPGTSTDASASGKGRFGARVGPARQVLGPGGGRVRRQVGLGEDDELAPLPPLPVHVRPGVERGCEVEHDRLGLSAGDAATGRRTEGSTEKDALCGELRHRALDGRPRTPLGSARAARSVSLRARGFGA